jgi:energy-coupling factor transporter ATP-binding protein EcfA2
MAAIDQIIEWAQALPGWKSDAVRRILTQENLTSQDEADILAMLKESCGLRDPSKPAPAPNPAQRGLISGAPRTKVRVVLKVLNDLKNVNAIPDKSYIPLAHEGLTVIYGENGSGKSGYARVMKKACSARDTEEQIYPNVLSGVVTGPASAVFTVGIDGGADQDIAWVDDGSKSDLLANIIVFDSKGARVIVDDENDISFRPYGTHVFDHLLNLLNTFRERLQQEKPNPSALRYPSVPPESTSGRFLTAISVDTPTNVLDAATSWTEADIERLSQLKSRINTVESPDRNAKIRRLKSHYLATLELTAELNKMVSAMSEENEQKITRKIEELKIAEEALAIVAKQSVGDEPLSGVGEKVWQALYLAAREYSTQCAYPERHFPAHDEGDRCVFCMQKLDADARARFIRFQEFMEQSTKKKVEALISEVRAILEPMRLLNFSKFDQQSDIGQEILARSTLEMVKKIEEYQVFMKRRANYLINVGDRKPSEIISLPKDSPMEEILKVAEVINKEREEIEKGETPEQLRLMKAQCFELEARKEIASHRDEIILYIETLKKGKKYDEAMAATHIGGVSAISKRIISESVTPALKAALVVELKDLGVNLPLDMKPTRADGEVVHKLVFTKGTLPKGASLTQILSEGEQRVVAIACFLAELSASGETTPIVFDDPVSSLDHRFRDKVAQRLASEGLKRQVIIFTHDIAFLVALQGHADRLGTMMSEQTIRLKDRTPGFSAQGVPWHAMNVNQRLDLLLKKMPELDSLATADQERYNEEAASLYGKLRESWEACVEEGLFNKVIRRHSSEIQTQRLHSVQVTSETYEQFYFAFDKCCGWMTGHDKSKALM